MPTVSVAMCTFDGAEYLRAQLDSIANQTRPPDEIVICDDGSSDDTLAILRDFAAGTDIRVRVEVNPRCLGTKLNFDRAISLCRGDYVFLSDQDDVWRPQKIEEQSAQLQEMERQYGRDTPILVHSDLEVVGPALDRIAPSFMARQRLSPLEGESQRSLLIQNYVVGCATAINRALIERARPIPEDCIMHDWWLALCAAACGHIGFNPAPLTVYRQHGGNQRGSHGVRGRYNPFRRNYRENWRASQEFRRHSIQQAALLFERLASQKDAGAGLLAAAEAYASIPQQPLLRRLRLLWRHGLRHQDPLFQLWMNVKIALL